MKTKTLLSLLVLLVTFPILTEAQEMQDASQTSVNNALTSDSQKGKFNIAIQNFAFGEIYGSKNSYSFSARLGYMISDQDMVFLDGQFSLNPIYQVDKTIELGLNYRRYFGNSSFQPFVQSGIALGQITYVDDYYTNDPTKYYGVVDIGAGVSFRHKRWRFEVGIQTEFNHNYSGRVYLLPLFGISFSF